VKKLYLFTIFTAVCIFCQGQSWTRITAIPKADIFSFELQGNVFYASSSDKVYAGTNNGTSWTPSASLRNVGLISTVTLFDNKLFAGTFSGGAFRSSDDGQSWEAVNNGLGLLSINKFAIWKGHLYAATGGEGVYVFNETNSTWSAFNNNFPTSVDGNVWDLIATDSTLYAAAGANGILHRYNPATGNWDDAYYRGILSPGLIARTLVSEGNILFAGLSTSPVTLYRSEDFGNHWVRDDNGMIAPGFPVLTADNSKRYMAVNDFENGINMVRFYERDKNAAAGSVWNKTDSVINGFYYAIGYAGSRLYAATDSGLYYKELLLTSVPGVPGIDMADIRIFPNPAIDNAHIVFHFTEPQKVTVQVMDSGGKLVARLFDKQQVGSGEQLLPINVNRLSEAVYFINIITAGGQQTKKLVVRH
jgi:Secretion system C-terminal sorting domain